ncbi:PREDICTED: transmembrane protein 127-like [Priapulus caudatus]|uniref:Transmembrane protein 127-like n=1 Tax=Priapulus caudatus TaxID=37621 RepID=A0ABM1ENP8_PRICU|nr:PREDICTED: transmembrane protein 127-like [Priapulus caudatus]
MESSVMNWGARNWKHRERNLVSAACTVLVLAMLSVALAQDRWFWLNGGGCDTSKLGVIEFLGGHFIINTEEHTTFYSAKNELLTDCVTESIVRQMRVVIAMVHISICCSLFTFVVDTVGVTTRPLKLLRRMAVGSVVTVLVCCTICGFCYWITVLLGEWQKTTMPSSSYKVTIRFDIGFYLTAGAGTLSVITTATNSLKRYPSDGEDDQALMDSELSPGMSHQTESSLQVLPAAAPPPPYTP